MVLVSRFPQPQLCLRGSVFAVLTSRFLPPLNASESAMFLTSQLRSWFWRQGGKLTVSELMVLVSRFPRPQFWLHVGKLTVSGPVVMASQFWICGSGFAVPAVMILDSPHSSRSVCGSEFTVLAFRFPRSRFLWFWFRSPDFAILAWRFLLCGSGFTVLNPLFRIYCSESSFSKGSAHGFLASRR